MSQPLHQPAHPPRQLDVAALATEGGAVSGEWPLAGLKRLLAVGEALPLAQWPAPHLVTWRAGGTLRPLPGTGAKVRLTLHAQCTAALFCQRCLGPLLLPLQVQREFYFVPGEDVAAKLDDELEVDVLELTPALDLHELIEDELILALPLVPRHADCTLALPAQDAAAGNDHPFGVLAHLLPPAGTA